MVKPDKIIMGIDPGTNVMGYGVINIVKDKALMGAMGVINISQKRDPYERLGYVFECVTRLIKSFKPNEMAIESQFYGKNVQSMLKLGRAQGVAIAAAVHRDIHIYEYAPMKIKMAITGNGRASKEQVAGMLKRILKIEEENMPKYMDATDALAVAYCHYMQSLAPTVEGKRYKSWKDYALKNSSRISSQSKIKK